MNVIGSKEVTNGLLTDDKITIPYPNPNLMEKLSEITLRHLSIALSSNNNKKKESRAVVILNIYSLSLISESQNLTSNSNYKVEKLCGKLAKRGKLREGVMIICLILTMTSDQCMGKNKGNRGKDFLLTHFLSLSLFLSLSHKFFLFDFFRWECEKPCFFRWR
jgi:hypothetical protein